VRILLAAKHAPDGSRPIGGVQSWCRTVAQELRRLGHHAETWGPEQPLRELRFDLGIFANVGDTAAMLPSCGKVLAVCHGIIPAEAPPAGLPVVFTSEGVRDHWRGAGPVVRQPIDLEFWSRGAGTHAQLLRYSYRRGLGWLGEVAAGLGMTFRHMGDVTQQDARAALRSAACVLATGRAALEAMACGVPVVICDHRSAYQGPLLDADVRGAMARNYSGRNGVTPTRENVAAAVQDAIAEGSMRYWIEQHHDVRDIVPQLLEAACCTC
jgi:hypothetical protein